MEDFGVDGGFNINGHSSILCGSAIEDCFELFCHGMLAGNGFVCHDLAGPAFDKQFFKEGGVCSDESVEDDLLDGRRFG